MSKFHETAFLWILPEGDILPDKEGCPIEFLLPKKWLKVQASTLLGHPVWIVSRLADSFILWGCVTPTQLFQILDPPNSGDYIIRSDLRRSFRLGGSVIIDELGNPFLDTVALLECPDYIHRQATKLSINATPVLVRPRHFEFPWQISTLSSATMPHQVSRMIAHFSAKHSFSELSRWGKVPELSPPAAAALINLVKQYPEKSFQFLFEAVKILDPIGSITTRSDSAISKDHPFKDLPSVDTFFGSINPDLIVARKYVEATSSTYSDSLRKTELAERTHQQILGAISRGLLSEGLTPQESCSVDLAIIIEDAPIIFEIKSAYANNFIDQTSKGLFQLHRYSLALEQEERPPRCLVLIIQALSGSSGLMDYVRQISSRLGAKVLFCDLTKPWPASFSGIHDLLEAHGIILPSSKIGSKLLKALQ